MIHTPQLISAPTRIRVQVPTVIPAMAMAGAILLALALPTAARAWGPHGHRIATRVAEERLTARARAAVRELLLEGDTLVDVSNWADHEGHDAVPGSAPWHYVNVPIEATRYEPSHCERGECVVAKIGHFRSVLADRRAPRRERLRALRFLIHLVVDVHQPLHVGDHGDRGGNQTQIQFLDVGTNFHRLWDSDLINDIDRNERTWVQRIEPLLSPENVRAWSQGSVEDWATESLIDARKAYFFPAGARRPLTSGATLGRDYVGFARPILERRLAQAGVRVANELNAVFR
jgi:hypothetical protein